jgi:hypothetical protein
MPTCSRLSSKTGQKQQHDSEQCDSEQNDSNRAGTSAPQGQVPAAFAFPAFRDLISKIAGAQQSTRPTPAGSRLADTVPLGSSIGPMLGRKRKIDLLLSVPLNVADSR